MSLSDLFGDLGDEDDEEDYRPDANQISDIESADEMDSAAPPQNATRSNEPTHFPLGQELLKPMKPPEFDSDDDSPITRPSENKRHHISSDDDADESLDLRQLNKNLFGSDNESDEDEGEKKQTPVKTSPAQQKPVPSVKQADTSTDSTSNRPLQNADDFFRDSDDEVVTGDHKTTTADLFGSDMDDDSEGEKPATSTAATQEEIFGSDLSMSEDEQKQKVAPLVSDGDDDMGVAAVQPRSDGESEEEGEEKGDEESELPVEMPLTDISLGNQLNLVKLPNFLSVDTRPFDPETYEDEIEDDNEVTDDEGRARLKLRVENTIRWRHALDDNGNLIKQSNSRIVKWSDGSMSLFVGTEEFDVLQAPLTGAHSHLYVKHGAGIQGQAQFQSKMMFRIHSTDSYTHKKLTMRISDRVSKASKAKTLPAVGKNPEAQRQELLKKEDERQAASRRRENMQKKIREKRMNKSISTRYLEPDIEDDEAGESLAAIKNTYKSGGSKKKQQRKKPQKKVSEVYSSEEEEEEEPLSEDEEEEEEAVATDSDSADDRKKPKKKPTIIDDEEDSD